MVTADKPAMDAVMACLRAGRFPLTREDRTQSLAAAHLAMSGFVVEREVALSANDRIDIVSGPVTVEFAGYRSSFSGRPAVALRLTNNSGVTIFNAACRVEAKRGNVILDAAFVSFANLGDIRPGEAAEDEGTWVELDSLDDFDSEPFDLANVNCTRLVRR